MGADLELSRQPPAGSLQLRVCAASEPRAQYHSGGWSVPTCGPVAQLGARMNGIHEVTGSIPVWSISPRSARVAGPSGRPSGRHRLRLALPARLPSGHQHVHNQGFADCVSVEHPRIAEHYCVTMSYMKTSTITIRLDDALGRELDQACARTGRTRSELARDALRRQLALLRFERLRRRTLPLAESQGYLTDEDIFRDVS